MDVRTIMRELDEVIARVQSVTEREIALSHILPDSRLRRSKQEQVRTMRGHVQRLRSLRCAVKAERRLGSRLY
jgi:hypothetical protein